MKLETIIEAPRVLVGATIIKLGGIVVDVMPRTVYCEGCDTEPDLSIVAALVAQPGTVAMHGNGEFVGLVWHDGNAWFETVHAYHEEVATHSAVSLDALLSEVTAAWGKS